MGQYYQAPAFTELLPEQSIIIPPDAETFADVSFYQARMDWSKYPHRAAVIRLGQNTWKDSEFEYNYAELKRLKKAIGGYWFFDGRASPQTQYEIIRDMMVGKSLEMELFVDWERSYSGAYEGIVNVISLMKKLQAGGIACKDVGLYTGYYWFLENTSLTTEQADYLKARPLWLAWYSSASVVKVPPPWTTWEHWQYGTPAIYWGQPTVEIDANKHNGSLNKYLAAEPPPTGGVMKEGTARVDLNIRSGVYPAPVIGMLRAGDKAYGEVDPISGWLHIQWIIRVSGAREDFDGWCSGSASYITLIDYVPPASHVVVVDITADIDGEIYGADGVELVKR